MTDADTATLVEAILLIAANNQLKGMTLLERMCVEKGATLEAVHSKITEIIGQIDDEAKTVNVAQVANRVVTNPYVIAFMLESINTEAMPQQDQP